MSELTFKGIVFNGSLELDSTAMVCVPSKPHYAQVDICLRADCNVVVASIDNNCLSFEEKQKLGHEIVKRWNDYAELKNQILIYARENMTGYVFYSDEDVLGFFKEHAEKHGG